MQPKVTRPNKDEYYLNIAKAVGKRSPCIRKQFGAIIVKNDTVVSTGYNGPARGVVNCIDVGCIKNKLNIPSYTGYDYCPGVHAEENSIINAARHGVSVIDGILYLYGQKLDDNLADEVRPCNRCKRAIINAGIKEVVTKSSGGVMKRYKVSEWIKEDTKNYIKEIKCL